MRPWGWAKIDENGYPLRSKPLVYYYIENRNKVPGDPVPRATFLRADFYPTDFYKRNYPWYDFYHFGDPFHRVPDFSKDPFENNSTGYHGSVVRIFKSYDEKFGLCIYAGCKWSSTTSVALVGKEVDQDWLKCQQELDRRWKLRAELFIHILGGGRLKKNE
jgi:hypothetical protein